MRFRTARRAGSSSRRRSGGAIALRRRRPVAHPTGERRLDVQWSGAATMNVDVKPWGGGYVRSTPYLIDCPMACIRRSAAGTARSTLTA